ncbi:MAG: hypothetical protein LUH11_00005, partial [Candidatus Gastranaerophilales bacterium]|nr:hypothetical protein [Candidatus Gastranaerophilales bacterium]
NKEIKNIMMSMKKNTRSFNLLKINIFITILMILSGIIILFCVKAGKNDYFLYNMLITGFLFFIYLFLFSNQVKKDLLTLKKEVLYINYNYRIFTFLILLFAVLTVSAIFLISVNKEAANAAFIFTFFMSTITMLFPYILLLVLVYFIVPAFVVPGISINKNKNSNSSKIIVILFILYLIFCIYKMLNRYDNLSHFESQYRIKSSKLTVNYSTDFLKLKDISDYGKKLMSQDKLKIPFFYTSDSFPYDDYESAEIFCNSLEARVPNYLEVYHIVFNNFDTFGEQYYWTSDKDGKQNLVLHFKNMSYEIIKRPKDIRPYVYCAADTKDELGIEKKIYFYRNIRQEQKETIKSFTDKEFNFDNLNELLKQERKEQKIIEQQNTQITEKYATNTDKKYVNFSVKEVTSEVFQELIRAGYSYNPAISVNQEYETNDFMFSSSIINNSGKIRLCYYPFTDYENLNIKQEKEIWKQSFCSPAFDLVSMTPVIKTKNEKDSYCYANGGRLPNIPELNGILKTLGKNQINVKYWTNNTVSNISSNATMPVLVYYKDSRFMTVHALASSENDNAYAYCIKNPENPSRVIANYKSRFENTEGSFYAKQKCPDCDYYEVPDTILRR